MSHKPLAKINRIAPETNYSQGRPGKHFSAAFDDPLEYIRLKNSKPKEKRKYDMSKRKKKENTTH